MLTCIDRPLCLPFWISGDLARVSFNNCVVVDAVGGTQRKIVLSQLQGVPSFDDTVFHLQSQIIPGALIQTVNPEDREKEADRGAGLRWVNGQWALIPLPNPNNPMDGTFTLAPKDDGTVTALVPSGLVVRGDLIVLQEELPNVLANPDGGAGPVLLGRVTGITPELDPDVDPTSTMWPKTQTLTLNSVPIALRKKPVVPMKVHLFVAYLPRIHPPTLGDVKVMERNHIINVTSDGWHLGNRILGQGIPIGSFIIAIDYFSREIIISKPVAADQLLPQRLFDADVHQVNMLKV